MTLTVRISEQKLLRKLANAGVSHESPVHRSDPRLGQIMDMDAAHSAVISHPSYYKAQWAKIAILVSLVKIFLVNHKNILIHLLYIFSKIFGYNQISSFLQNLKCQYLLNEKS